MVSGAYLQDEAAGPLYPASAHQVGNFAVFLYGFAKSERGNIGPDELQTLHDAAAAWIAADAALIARALAEEALQEVYDDEARPP
jgi:hypothetical protein